MPLATLLLPPALLTRDKEEEGLTRANEQIKKLTGRYARGYRSPSWDLSPNSIELLLKHGFTYDSSMMGNDYEPYFARRGDKVVANKPLEFGEVTDVAPLVAFLCRPEAGWITAQTIRVNGGLA